MTENRLASETSPYLLQHAHNPVDWNPWGPDALASAKSQNKPAQQASETSQVAARLQPGQNKPGLTWLVFAWLVFPELLVMYCILQCFLKVEFFSAEEFPDSFWTPKRSPK